ncbi:MAG: hypothetical protein FWD77_01205 [Betaproteobacteria bacterium]|nr:hypothetical protein [Betaproteobacteria bacterium]
MQALLSFEQTPPFAVPARFFLTAPCFVILAAILMCWAGPEEFESRWNAAVLAFVHLFTAGFMLQTMLGALIQILPVVAGASIGSPLALARFVHALIAPGALFLAAALLWSQPWLHALALLFLGAGAGGFVFVMGRALWPLPATNPTASGLKIALGALPVAVLLGFALVAARNAWLALPGAGFLMHLTDIHFVWGAIAWGLILVSAVAYVVVPMFLLTPPYPRRFGKGFAPVLLALAIVWTVLAIVQWEFLAGILRFFLAGGVIAFAATTLILQQRSKRARLDTTQRYWAAAMCCALAASALWVLAACSETVDSWRGWPLLFGILLFPGAFMSVISGMLYKIVPFLSWLHLQNRSTEWVAAGGILKADRRPSIPNMKNFLPEGAMKQQQIIHFSGLLLLASAIAAPEFFFYPAAALLGFSGVLLQRNLIMTMRAYRRALASIDASYEPAPVAPFSPLPH